MNEIINITLQSSSTSMISSIIQSPSLAIFLAGGGWLLKKYWFEPKRESFLLSERRKEEEHMSLSFKVIVEKRLTTLLTNALLTRKSKSDIRLLSEKEPTQKIYGAVPVVKGIGYSGGCFVSQFFIHEMYLLLKKCYELQTEFVIPIDTAILKITTKQNKINIEIESISNNVEPVDFKLFHDVETILYAMSTQIYNTYFLRDNIEYNVVSPTWLYDARINKV